MAEKIVRLYCFLLSDILQMPSQTFVSSGELSSPFVAENNMGNVYLPNNLIFEQMPVYPVTHTVLTAYHMAVMVEQVVMASNEIAKVEISRRITENLSSLLD